MTLALSMTIDFSNRIRVPADVMVSHLGGETVLLNLATEVYFGLDEVGTVTWEAARQSPTIGDAYLQLQNEFDVNAETLKSDLIEFLSSLASHGLVELE